MIALLVAPSLVASKSNANKKLPYCQSLLKVANVRSKILKVNKTSYAVLYTCDKNDTLYGGPPLVYCQKPKKMVDDASGEKRECLSVSNEYAEWLPALIGIVGLLGHGGGGALCYKQYKG